MFQENVINLKSSFYFQDYSMNSFDRSRSGTPSIVNQQKQAPPKHPPMFITVIKLTKIVLLD